MEYRFLLVSLNIDAVLEEVTISQRKKKLGQMIKGGGLRDGYSATLARIKAQKGSKARLGIEMLMWLSHSERPLNSNELCHALGVEIGSTDLDYQNIPAIETLLGCSQGLVIVEASSYTVRLVHYTLKEYLSNNTDLFDRPHSMIAEVCLTYLGSQCIGDLLPILGEPSPATPLLEYASCYWGIHARREITRGVNKLALGLLDRFENHVSSAMLLSNWGDNWDRKLRRSNSMGFTGLHGVAHLGIVETAVALLEMKKWDLSATDMAGNTAILWAARRGHGEIVKILLASNRIAGNIPDTDGRTPLSWAASLAHKGIVKLLLKNDVDPDTPDRDGRTPLSWAAEFGREGITKMLLQCEDVAPDTTDKTGLTPHSWAAGNGHTRVMGMLRQRSIVGQHLVATPASQTVFTRTSRK